MKLEEGSAAPAPVNNGSLPSVSLLAAYHHVSDNEYWNYCDNCGTRLETFRCRYVCPKCGFFHSCSEP